MLLLKYLNVSYEFGNKDWSSKIMIFDIQDGHCLYNLRNLQVKFTDKLRK